MQLALLQEIPGVDWTLAAVIISELGVDMSVFGNVSQLASWRGFARQQRIGRKRKSSRIPEGQCLSEDGFGGGSQRGGKSQGHLLEGQILPSQKPTWNTSARP